MKTILSKLFQGGAMLLRSLGIHRKTSARQEPRPTGALPVPLWKGITLVVALPLAALTFGLLGGPAQGAEVEEGTPEAFAMQMGEGSGKETNVTGVVRLPDGKPAAGLTVRIIGGHSEPGEARQTDAEGRFDLKWNPSRFGGSDATFCLIVRDPVRNLAVAHELEEDSGPLDLRLGPGLTLVGDAVCEGKPVTNATTALVFWSGDSGMHIGGLCVGTNTPGHFEIPALPLGRRYGFYVSAPGYGQKYVNVTETADAARVEIDPVELKPANLKLAGQVVDADDKPVTDANVNLQGEGQPNGQAKTDKEGRFRFEHVCDGPVRLYANARGAYANISAEGGDTNVVLKLGESSPSYGGAKTHKLSGIVTDPAGKPMSGAWLKVFPTSGGSRELKAGTNGAFNLTWGLQEWQLQQGNSAVLVIRDTVRNLAAAEDLSEEVTNLNVQLKPGVVIAGRVEGPDGKPIADASISLMLMAARTYSTVDEKAITTGADGKFEIKALAAGPQYIISAQAKDRSHVQQQIEANTETNRIELEPFVLKVADRVISGQVTDLNDKPLSGVNISISGDDQPQSSATTDSKGRFSFKVCEGTVSLFASGQNGGYANTSAEAGDTNVVVQLGRNDSSVRMVAPRAALKGKPLPDLAGLGIAADAVPTGKPVLLCLVDVEQRPSRRVARLLAEQHAALQQQGVTVLAVQAAAASAEAVKEWQGASPVPFPVGRVADTPAKTTKWATTVESLPWLILTDSKGRVVDEGFTLDELPSKMKGAAK